jgi:hypothetical protein
MREAEIQEVSEDLDDITWARLDQGSEDWARGLGCKTVEIVRPDGSVVFAEASVPHICLFPPGPRDERPIVCFDLPPSEVPVGSRLLRPSWWTRRITNRYRRTNPVARGRLAPPTN